MHQCEGCVFQQARKSNICRVEALMPDLIDRAITALDARQINQGFQALTSEAAGLPTTKDAIFGIGIGPIEDEITELRASGDVRLAETVLEGQQIWASTAAETCHGPKARKRWGLFGKTVMHCTSPDAKRYDRYQAEVVAQDSLAALEQSLS